ncbi:MULTISPECIES: hypothetical protein [Lachnospiraceae]|jgi:hypothetical protein|uniref:hypothetical protein n=1 Tax=Lachnospiraceae TaxID=186803 RepID=UPI0011DDD9AC|nr:MULTISPECIES: hypothetical protein [Hungatella]MBC5705843.1 hypothetical protein [Hungatella sp. L36]MBS5071807.1 hypothetical protein [Hungatella hathewayi]MBS5242691.1 hypothetical protein [Hungatella hathewayi]
MDKKTIHNIELFKSHTAPRHTAFRIHDPIGLFKLLQEKVSVFLWIPPLLRSDGLTIELLNVSVRKAAVYVYWRNHGCFLCFKVSARCRGPPFSKILQKFLKMEERPCGREIMDRAKQRNCRTVLHLIW